MVQTRPRPPGSSGLVRLSNPSPLAPLDWCVSLTPPPWLGGGDTGGVQASADPGGGRAAGAGGGRGPDDGATGGAGRAPGPAAGGRGL